MGYFPIIVSGLCGFLLSALVAALIVSESFRSDVLGGEGEASILGILTVKGVAIVILCGLFTAGLIYPLHTAPNVMQISEMIRTGLSRDSSQAAYANMLMDIIKNDDGKSVLGDKLVTLAEERGDPFKFSSKVVNLIHGSSIPSGIVGVCENSDFIAKNILVIIEGDNGSMKRRYNLYADSKYTTPCPIGGERLHVNINLDELSGHKFFAKRTL